MKTDTLTKNKKSSNPYSINSEKGQIGLYLKKNDSTAKPGKKTKIFKVEQISHYPSPFDQKTTIVYKLDHPSCVSLVVYSSSSSGMTYLACGHKREGYHKVDFDASKLPSGIYVARLRTDIGVTKSFMTKLGTIHSHKPD